MFDLNDTSSSRLHKGAAGVGGMSFQEPREAHQAENPLDGEAGRELHGRLMSFWRQEVERQAENRADMALDEDFYDHIQWSEKDAAELEKRGQMPLVYNVISQSINWIIGSEKRGRTDFKVLPRGKEDAKAAEGKTKLMKYLSDVNRTPFSRSRAFSDAVKVGVGWLEDGYQDDDDSEPVYSRWESWRNILWDSAAREIDLADARYEFRQKWVDVDIAKALFRDRAGLIESSAADADTLNMVDDDGDEAMDSAESERNSASTWSSEKGYSRQRVRLIECWYRKPTMTKKHSGGPFHGQPFRRNSVDHKMVVLNGQSTIIEKFTMQVRVAVMTVDGLLYEAESPYRHNRFPFTPIWCFRRGRDGLPYGYIRGMRNIQEDINKRASKALAILSSNKVIMDNDAVEDIDEFAEEIARPDAIIRKKRGSEMIINADRELAAGHIEMMSRSIQMIQQISGVTDELLGRTTNAVSGRAINARQDQGQLATSDVFDNLRLASQQQGEIQLSLIEQFFDEQKEFRITNERGVPEFVIVNDGLPENDITRTKADFVISESEWRATLRQSAVEVLTRLLERLPPEISVQVLDLVVDSMDVPNREEIVRRIRMLNQQRDPDATEPTPEEMQRAEAQQKQQRAREAMFMAQLRKLVAEALKAEAEVAKSAAAVEQQKVESMGARVAAATSAMEAAAVAVTNQSIVPIADMILKEAGWDASIPPPPAAVFNQVQRDGMANPGPAAQPAA